jgi:tripeptide aminopeptidase
VTRCLRFVPAALVLPLISLAAFSSPVEERQDHSVAHLLHNPAVQAALDAARRREPHLIDEQVRLCEIPAPPFGEARRAAAYADLFRGLGLRNVRIDREGNVLGERPGAAARPHLVFSAHLDTVFPEGTDVTVTRDGPVLKGPGISDDCRGLAVVAGVARALDEGGVRTPGTITFVGTVGEEGLGDLRGVKHLLSDELRDRVDAFVSVDGSGASITTVAVGSRRYRVSYQGPGGHSYGAFGIANPVHALGRAIAGIADLEPPGQPKTTFNVGRVGGGTSVNSIAFEAWMEVDLRSADPDALGRLDRDFLRIVRGAESAENTRWSGQQPVRVSIDRVGERPAGQTPSTAPIVRAAQAANRALGLPDELGEGSTDANFPISLGIPAVTIGGGGRGRAAHSLEESFDTTDSWKGTQRAVLLAIALAQ